MRESWAGARPYQVAALEAVEQRKLARGIVAIPTGGGKGWLAGHFAEALGTDRVLYLAHRDELIEQLLGHVGRVVGAGNVGVEAAERKAAPMNRCVIASVPTLAARGGRRLEELGADRFEAIVVDEAHHGTAESYLGIWRHFGLLAVEEYTDEQGRSRQRHVKAASPRVPLVGLTATPGRGDGVGLHNVFDGITYQYRLEQAIRDGWLVRIRAYTVETGVCLDDVATKGTRGDYREGDLDRAINTDRRCETIADAAEKYAPGRKSIVFGVTIAHAENLARHFSERGRNARYTYGADPERADTLRWFRQTPGAVLCNVALFTEGVDVPSIEAVVMARPTRSATLYAQALGRGTRLADGARDYAESVARGKAECILIDVTDATENVGRRAVNVMDIFGAPLPCDRLAGEDVLDAVEEQEQDVAQEKERARRRATRTGEFDLFAPIGSVPGAKLRWLRYGADGLMLSLPDRSAVRVTTDALDRWLVERLDPAKREWGAWIDGQPDRGIALGEAEKRIAEEFTEKLHVLESDAGWRRAKVPPTEKQIALARKLRIPIEVDAAGTPTVTKGQLSDAIDRVLAEKRFA